MFGRRVLAATVLATTALAACGGTDEPAAEPAPAPAATAAPADEPAEQSATDAPGGAVPAALDFSAPLVGGGEIEMGQYAGRPVLLWFWAPW